MNSISPDYTSNQIEDNDPIFPNYPQDFVEFALFDQEFFDTAQYLPLIEQGSPKTSSFVDDEAPVIVAVQESNDVKGDSCSGATKGRRDRSKTIVTERKRRVRMKERLYELRSLVPNITKMDKASIIADAVEYVRDLQSQAKSLEDEISILEFSFTDQEEQAFQNIVDSARHDDSTVPVTTAQDAGAMNIMILQIDAFEIGNRRYMVTLECEHRHGAAVSLYSAVESLAGFRVENSNLSLNSGKFVATLTLSVEEYEGVMNASTLYLELAAALLEKGFQLQQH